MRSADAVAEGARDGVNAVVLRVDALLSSLASLATELSCASVEPGTNGAASAALIRALLAARPHILAARELLARDEIPAANVGDLSATSSTR